MIFVTGGARSGKSAFALRKASSLAGDDVTFMATAEALDGEMTERIERHKLERNLKWQTLEEALEIESVLERAAHRVIVLDCVALWVSNMLLAGVSETAMLERTAAFIASATRLEKTTIVVSNEVGLGIVPDNALARAYRDALGRVNQRFAAASSEAYLLVSGLALRLK
jgi:adenosylcobinamide kinase / adenosylcobinamide-phosphate guanylyltransferase